MHTHLITRNKNFSIEVQNVERAREKRCQLLELLRHLHTVRAPQRVRATLGIGCCGAQWSETLAVGRSRSTSDIDELPIRILLRKEIAINSYDLGSTLVEAFSTTSQ
jgi:hypothetical protein